MKKTIIATLIVSIFFAFTCTASAATSGGEAATEPATPVSTDTPSLTGDSGIAPQSSTSCTLVFTRTSSSAAKAQAMAARPGATSVTSTLTLQKKSNGSYSKVTSASKTVKDDHINHIKTFSVASSGAYRLKVTISYKENGVTRGNTYYKTLS